MWHKVPFLFLAALTSAAFFVAVVIGWSRTGPLSGCVGWGEVRESTPTAVVTDSYNMQNLRGSLWVGETRVSVASPIGFKGEHADVEAATINVDVFKVMDRLSPRPTLSAGFGRVSGTAMDGPVRFDVNGVVVPCWFLAILTAILPAVWLRRRVRAVRRAS